MQQATIEDVFLVTLIIGLLSCSILGFQKVKLNEPIQYDKAPTTNQTNIITAQQSTPPIFKEWQKIR